ADSSATAVANGPAHVIRVAAERKRPAAAAVPEPLSLRAAEPEQRLSLLDDGLRAVPATAAEVRRAHRVERLAPTRPRVGALNENGARNERQESSAAKRLRVRHGQSPERGECCTARSDVKQKRGCWQARRLEWCNAPLAASRTAAPRFHRRMECRNVEKL